MVTQYLQLFLALMMMHALFDFPLQGESIANEKSRHSTSNLQRHVPWFYWLTAHALCHGLGVLAITRSYTLAVLEVVSHWLIDFGKCEKWYSIHVDQALHASCKVVWIVLLLTGILNGN